MFIFALPSKCPTNPHSPRGHPKRQREGEHKRIQGDAFEKFLLEYTTVSDTIKGAVILTSRCAVKIS